MTTRHPETHARRHQIDEVEATLPVADMVKAAASEVVVEHLTYPVLK